MTSPAEVLALFAPEARARFVSTLAQLLHAHFPDARALPRGELRAGVEAQVARAEALGLAAEAHAAQYVITSWLLGAGFDEQFPEARRVLRSGLYPPSLCAAWLDAWTRAVLLGLEED